MNLRFFRQRTVELMRLERWRLSPTSRAHVYSVCVLRRDRSHLEWIRRLEGATRRSIFAIFGLLGLLLSLEAQASDDIVPPVVYAVTPTGVNLSDGTFTFSQTDLSLGPISLERFHLSGLHDPAPTLFGPHMSNNYDIFIKVINTITPPPSRQQYMRAIVHIGNTATSQYDIDWTTTPWFITPYANDAYSGSLSYNGTNYTYIDRDGVIYNFSATIAPDSSDTKRIDNIVYPDGHKLTFAYNSSPIGQPRLVTDSRGYAILFDYNASSTISAACAFDLAQTYVTTSSTCSAAALKTTYAYTGANLTSVTDVLNNTTSYSYTASAIVPEITCVKPPGYATCKIANTYDVSYPTHIKQQDLADGNTWKFSATCDPGERTPGYASTDDDCLNIVTDPNNINSYYHFTSTSPYYFTDANGHTTQYRYTGGNLYSTAYPVSKGAMLIEATLPDGNKYTAAYDSAHYNVRTTQTWKAKPGSGLADQSEVLAFPTCSSPYTRQNCTKPISRTDARNNVTNYDYYSWGGIKYEMRPAPTSGAARPLKLYTYVQKYPYILNSVGVLVTGPDQIWMPDTETECQTVAGSSSPVCDTSAQQTVTTYAYGASSTADNLLVRSKVVTSGGVSLRTCYGYDTSSNKIWETSPRAATCP